MWVRTSFQPINVLCVHSEELTLLVKQLHKVMAHIGLVVAWIQLFSQGEEWIRVMVKEVDLEYGLGIRQVVLLQIVIQTAARSPVRKPGSEGPRAARNQVYSTITAHIQASYLKSGIPLGVLMPAPAITTTLLCFFFLMSLAMSFRVCCSVAAPPLREKMPRVPCGEFVGL